MGSRSVATAWQKAFRRVVSNPAVEVIAAIVVVLLSAWIVIETETDARSTLFPVLFGHK